MLNAQVIVNVPAQVIRQIHGVLVVVMVHADRVERRGKRRYCAPGKPGLTALCSRSLSRRCSVLAALAAAAERWPAGLLPASSPAWAAARMPGRTQVRSAASTAFSG